VQRRPPPPRAAVTNWRIVRSTQGANIASSPRGEGAGARAASQKPQLAAAAALRSAQEPHCQAASPEAEGEGDGLDDARRARQQPQ
jgi:hypothetical protein